MERIALRVGEYKGCGVTLHVRSVDGGGEIDLEQQQGPILSWTFTEDGTFKGLEADSHAKGAAGDMPATLLVCRHVSEGFGGKVVLRGVVSGSRIGWICCPECIVTMLSGSDVHLVDKEVGDELTRRCTVVDATVRENREEVKEG